MGQIRSDVHSAQSYFAERNLAPANVQRDYQWTPEQVAQLLTDLIRFAETSAPGASPGVYFLGTLIGLDQEGQVDLYDGLQRTTTLSLLFAYLRDRIADEALAARLHACLEASPGVPRLDLPPPDQTFVKDVVPRGATLTGIRGGFHGRRIALRRNQAAIARHLDGRSPEWLGRFARMMLEDTRLVLIRLAQPELAEIVFETVNMRGLAVQPHDLIKSRLAQLARDDGEADALVRGWDRVRQNVAEDFERFVTTTLDRMLHYPDTTRQDQYQYLSAWISEPGPGGSRKATEFVSGAEQLTFAWNRVRSCASGWTKAREMSPLLPVWVFSWTGWMPVAVELTRRSLLKEVPKGQLSAELDALQRFCLVCELAELSESMRRARFRRVLAALLDGKPLEPELALLRAELAGKVVRCLHKPLEDPGLRRTVMLWIESQGRDLNLNFLRHGPEQRASREVDPAQVEHVMPSNPAESSGWSRMVPQPEEQADVINLIGNLIVVPKSVNQELGRLDYPDKRRLLQKHGSRLKPFRTVEDALRTREWTADVIRERSRRMIDDLYRQLGIGLADEWMADHEPDGKGPDYSEDRLNA